MKRRSGFTLIELLVVVAIIGLLIAILIPSLNKVRKRAKATVCATNERGLVNSYRMYVQETKIILSSTGHGNSGAWDFQLLAQGGSPNLSLSPGAYYTKNGFGSSIDRLRFCPETASDKRFSGNSLGSSSLAWDCRVGPGGGSTGGYALNNWLYNIGSVNTGGSMPAGQFYPLLKLTNEFVVPVFADSIWHDVVPRDNDVQSPNTSDPGAGTERSGRTMADLAVNRHSRATNVSFWDGHVETVKLGDLWTLQWYRGWPRSTPMNVIN